MAPDQTRYVVRTEPGRGTADTIYTDNCGERWHTMIGEPSGGGTTGVTYAMIYPNGALVVKKYK